MPDILSDAALMRNAKANLRKFFDATTVEELMNVVYLPDQVRPRLLALHPDGKLPDQKIISIGDPGLPDTTRPLLRSQIQDIEHGNRYIYLHITPDGPRVDWESWTGWSEMPWKEFQKTRPTDAKIFRAKVAVVEYYNFGFSDETAWQSFSLESPDGENVIYGYVPKSSALVSQIADTIDGGGLLTLKLKFPNDARSSSQVLIESVVSDGWTQIPTSP